MDLKKPLLDTNASIQESSTDGSTTSHVGATHSNQPAKIANNEINLDTSKHTANKDKTTEKIRYTNEMKSMEIPADSYHVLIVLMTNEDNLWDSLPSSEQNAFYMFAIFSAFVQIGSIGFLFVHTCITNVPNWFIFTGKFIIFIKDTNCVFLLTNWSFL